MAAFKRHVNATIMWTAHNEIEARWDYIRSWDMMWINQTEVPVNQQKSYPDFTPVTYPSGIVDIELIQ